GTPLLDDKACNTLVDLCPYNREIGDRAVGDPALGAVKYPSTTILSGPGLHSAGVRPMVRLGQAEASDKLSLGHRGQVTILLFLRTGGIDGIHGQGALDRRE